MAEPGVSRNIPIRVDVHREEKRIKTVCQNTDKTINNNCLVSEDKTPGGGGGKSDTDKPPVQSRVKSVAQTNGAEEESGAGGPSVNSPHHPGVLRNSTGVTDSPADIHDNTIQQFENIQEQLEVQTPSGFNFTFIFSCFFVKFPFEMIIFEGCQEKVGGSIKIKRAAEDC